MRSTITKKKLNGSAIAIGAVAAVAVALFSFSRQTRYSFKDRVVLITGGSRGLGLLMARQLVDEGAKVAICARDKEELLRAGEELRARGGEVVEIICDVRRREECAATVEKTIEAFGGIDVLINNAGVIQTGPLESQTENDFRDSLDTHFWGPFHMTNAALPHLENADGARIVNIASIGGKIAVPHLAPYCTSKFALVGYSSALRVELAKKGITVTTICPGLMRTGSHINAEFKGQHEKEYALFSIMDAFPLSSINATRAARKILDASRSGRAEAIISIQTKTAAILHSVMPEESAALLAATNRFLPGGNGSKKKFTGLESTSSLSPSILTANIDTQAELNNELKPGETIA